MGLVGRLDDVVDDEVDVALPVEVALEVRSVEDVVPDEELMPVKVPAIAGFTGVVPAFGARVPPEVGKKASAPEDEVAADDEEAAVDAAVAAVVAAVVPVLGTATDADPTLLALI